MLNEASELSKINPDFDSKLFARVGIRGHMGAERHVDVLTELSSR